MKLLVNFLKLIQKYLLGLLFLIFFIPKSPYFSFKLNQVKHLKFPQEDHQLSAGPDGAAAASHLRVRLAAQRCGQRGGV